MSRNIFSANEGNGACFNVLAHIKVGKRQICAKYAICFFLSALPLIYSTHTEWAKGLVNHFNIVLPYSMDTT